MDIKMEIKETSKTIASFQRWNLYNLNADLARSSHMSHLLQGQAPGLPQVGWKYLVHSNTPTMIEWGHSDLVHRDSSARKITHSNIFF